jgi:hypothetical protein
VNARKWLRTEANAQEKAAKALQARADEARELARSHRRFAKEGEQREVEDYVRSLTDPAVLF